MQPYYYVTAFFLLVASSHISVTSFSIGSRDTKKTELAQALTVLHRQRRQVSPQLAYLNSDNLFPEQPLTLDDINDWLNSRPNDDWLTADENVDDFDESAMYRLGDLGNQGNGLNREEINGKELNDIFDKDDTAEDEELNDIFNQSEPEDLEVKKKNKEVPLDVVAGKKKEKKSESSTGNIDLNSLTEDEMKILMKAVEKIHEQRNKRSEGTVKIKETVEHESPEGDNVETKVEEVPAELDELLSIFGDSNNGEIVNGKSVENEEILTPDGKVSKTVEKQLIPESNDDEDLELENDILADIEKNLEKQVELEEAEEAEEQEEAEEEEAEEEEAEKVAASAVIKLMEEQEAAQKTVFDNVGEEEGEDVDTLIEPTVAEALGDKYWLMSHSLDKSPTTKRAAKRSTFSTNSRLDQPDIISLEDEDNGDSIGDYPEIQEVLPRLKPQSLPSVKAFVDKIVDLQNELERLRALTKLEDIENDKLTDALNEATLAQGRGSVSSTEFDALQQAIRIEEAIQDLQSQGQKKSRSSAPPDRIKSLADELGEAWRRKRGQLRERKSKTSPVFALQPVKRKDTSGRAELSKLLAEAYLLQQQDDYMDDVENADIASLFLPDAGSCPAVREYSSNCELADFYNLPVDDEARALCNLHEMCYACGHSLSIPQASCDSIYRDAAIDLCRGASSCEGQAEVFLRTMKLKTRYIPHSQTSCRAECTATFLGLL